MDNQNNEYSNFGIDMDELDRLLGEYLEDNGSYKVEERGDSDNPNGVYREGSGLSQKSVESLQKNKEMSCENKEQSQERQEKLSLRMNRASIIRARMNFGDAGDDEETYEDSKDARDGKNIGDSEVKSKEAKYEEAKIKKSETEKEKLKEKSESAQRKAKFCPPATWLGRNWSWALASGIVFAYMLIFMIIAKIAPFGGNSFTLVDSMHQYVPFFSDYQDKLKHFGSLGFTWDVGGGQNFQSLLLYYMASPVNLIIIFFSRKGLLAAMSIIIALKLVFSAGAFGYFLSRRRGRISNSLVITGFAVAYGLNNYMTGYYWNLNWLDCIMVLPLIILGFERLMKNHDLRMYTLAMFYSMFCNYYISFIICIFLILWFICSSHGDVKRDGEVKAYLKGFVPDGLRFAGASILAAGMACFSLVTAYLAITKTASAKLNFPKLSFYQSFAEIFKAQFILTKPLTNLQFDGGVNIYCGTFAVVLLFVYIFSDKIDIFEKLRKLLLLGFLILSFNTPLLNYIWHGFHDQYGIPNRFSFVFIFTLLVVGYETVTRMKRLSLIQVAAAGFMSLAALLTVVYLTDMSGYAKEGIVLLVSVILIIAYTAVLIIRAERTELYRKTTVVLGVIMILEMLFNAGFGMGNNNVADGAYHIKNTADTKRAKDTIDKYASLSGELFYREDMVTTIMLDESTYNNMNSLGTFCSTVRGDMVTAMGGLGFYTGANEYLYKGATPLTDDILGVRFIYTRDDSYYPEGANLKSVYNEDGIKVYENEDALPVAYAVNASIEDWEAKGPKVADTLNSFARNAAGMGDIFIPQKIYYTVSGTGCSVGINTDNTDLISYDATSSSVNIRAAFSVEENGRYFINIRGNYIEKIEYILNGETKTSGRYNIQMFDLGELNTADEVEMNIIFGSSRSDSGTATLYLSRFDEDALGELNKTLAGESMEITEFKKDTRIKGNISLGEGKLLMTSIPYDEGWKVYDNGKRVETVKLGGAFLGADIGAGEHEIEFRYNPPGMKIGIIVSVLSFMAYLVLWKAFKRKNKQDID